MALAALPSRALAASTFPDVSDGAWYAGAVTWARDNGVMNGYGDGTFRPGGELTREQAAAVLYNCLGGGASSPTARLGDVDQSAWYAKAVNWGVSSGTMQGYSGAGTFGVGDSLTREQLAVVMARVCGADLSSADASALSSFPDRGRASSWARPSLAWAVGNGVVSGFAGAGGTRTLAPQGTVTRAQMAAVVMNAAQAGLLEVGGGGEGVDYYDVYHDTLARLVQSRSEVDHMSASQLYSYYTLFDLTGDGVKELVVADSSVQVLAHIFVYTYDGQRVTELENETARNNPLDLRAVGNDLIYHNVNLGYVNVGRLHWDGSALTREWVDSHASASNEEIDSWLDGVYQSLGAEPLTMSGVNDYSLLRSAR